ncbi:Vacuolar protein sorting-associated protein 8 [Maudiozyma exigua]|uniref:Vacuolar protein sorting-associated protein 8 n=1 Tax=Maudiozyma exigua TaxID=34358 RepID=A0A9P7B4S4_MAUEX|nr:Vacuolar protein sorting-associated protein 8 [Kazachstania exigua]
MELLQYRPSPGAITIPSSQESRSSVKTIDNTIPIDGNQILSWQNLTHIYTLISAYGGPSCFLPANAYFVLGSTKGPVLIFDDKEYLQSILAPSCSIITSTSTTSNLNLIQGIRSPVTHLAISWDGTHLAAAYETGDIFIWDLNRTSKPREDQQDTDTTTDHDPLDEISPVYAILHIAKHVGSSINGLEFRDRRHTALVVSDLNGNVCYHNGHRTKLWQLTYSSTGMLTIPSNEILLSTSLHTVQKSNGMLAILTNKLFCITTIEQTLNENDSVIKKKNQNLVSAPLILYKNDVTVTQQNNQNGNHSIVPNNGISWYSDPITSSSVIYLSYFINSTVSTLVFRSTEQTKFQLLQNSITWQAPEPVLSITWITKSLLMLLTVSHQLIVVQPYDSFRVIMTIDLLPYNLLIPPNKFFKFYRNKLILLTHYSLKIAKFNQWSTLTLKKVQHGDYLGALNQLNKFSDPNFPIPTLLSLKTDSQERKKQLCKTFNNLTLAALKFLLKKHESEVNQNNDEIESNLTITSLDQLLEFAIQVQAKWFPDNKSNILEFLDLTWDSLVLLDDQIKGTFIGTIIDLIASNTIIMVPPSIFQQIIGHLVKKNQADMLAELQALLFNLDPSCWDVDLLVKTLQKHTTTNGFSNQMLLPYIWNIKFNDFLTPLVDLLVWIRDGNTSNCDLFKLSENHVIGDGDSLDPHIVYDYLSFVFSGTMYPSGQPIDLEKADKIKSELSYILFNGVIINWPLGSQNKLTVATDRENEKSFPYFNLLLNYDPSKFLAALNGIMEATFLNDDETTTVADDVLNTENQENNELHTFNVGRQYIIDILIELLKQTTDVVTHEQSLIAIFLALNIPKYPQFINISSYYLDVIVKIILSTKGNEERVLAESAVEAILPKYEPSNSEEFILELKENGFFRLLMSYYKINKRFSDMFSVCFFNEEIASNERSRMINDAIQYILQFNIKENNPTEYFKVIDIFKKHFDEILSCIGDEKVATSCEKLDPSLHDCILNIGSDTIHERRQRKYLDTMLGNSKSFSFQDPQLTRKYIELSCRYDTPEELHGWLEKLNFKILSASTINDIINQLESKKDDLGLAIIYSNQENYEKAVQNLINCINAWFASSRLSNDESEIMNLINDAINVSSRVKDAQSKQDCWIKLLACLVKQYRKGITDQESSEKDTNKNQVINKAIQYVFVKLSLMEDDTSNDRIDGKSKDPGETNFWHILAGVLEQQDIILLKIHDVNDLLQEVFRTYHLEEQMSGLILKILEQSSSDIVEQYQIAQKQGWSLVNNECEVCGKKLWGIGLESKIARIWEAKRKEQAVPKTEIFNGKIVLFRCNHGFHTKCLENLGQKHMRYSCLTCNRLSG